MINTHKTAMAVSAFAGLGHLVWSLVVAAGWGQAYIDWIFGLHFMETAITVVDFSWGGALYLIVVALIIGYIVGWVFATIWNWAHK